MILWLMIAAQLVAWGWFSFKGGTLPNKQFFVFTAVMLIGQFGAGIETYEQAAWRAFVVQAYFFAFTAIGGIQRFRQIRRARP
ncbi:MAG: hypothetical protein UY23_C0006G0048 [Candidatus Jorgensenbacteria bacterium GW2011_GWA1_48_11]|uniref:Uncharacterized protein n=1 Tax=Candidatus Jorgensenbacteria bacterium GW2011_GWA1_48_11 TaxID=1618660 RepID=A0A0G1U9R8_9BACT|nr:MAG: hypothetical protein UY23_C0006G0048 [Candidatus Jorgensenbacteria bacterium GW2011_GWA1_48_11]KKW12382.1 MAG: hypothetical protein UY51_C0005G0624 [Candidatus Jorgensenbacteria bacterium GW2011_GWB1_49_9]